MAMVDEQTFKSAITELRDVLHAYKTGDPRLEAMKFVLAGYESVIDRYQKVFSAENVCVLSEDEFRGFLLYKNNQHWIGLHRLGPGICKDMKKLGEALGILLDESQPIRVRLNKLAPSRGKKLVPRLGKAVLTPILLVAHPASYGVWNSVSESAMKALSIWPSLDRGAGLGDKYELINSVILRVANALETDLWTLDSLWWALLRLREGSEDAGLEDSLSAETIPATVDAPRFGLERHLHDFLRDNWTHTELGTQWYLY